MDPITAYFITQIFAPMAVNRGLDRLQDKDWRKRLVGQVAGRVDFRFNKRRVRRWLGTPRTWDLLFAPSEDGVRELTGSLAAHLRGTFRAILSDTRDQAIERAQQLTPHILAEFLASLDPAYATAVAHYREMEVLEEIKQTIQDREGFERHLSVIPPPVRRTLFRALEDDRDASVRLAALLAADESTPSRVAASLVNQPPTFLSAASPRLWVALAEAASADGLADAASTYFEKAADAGLPDRVIWYVRAALAAFEVGDLKRSDDLLRRAEGLDSSHMYPCAARAAMENDHIALRQLIDRDNDDNFLASLAAQSDLIDKRFDDVIARCEEILARDDEATGVRILLAEALFQRGLQGTGDHRETDFRRSIAVCLAARDLRRQWKGPSDEAVALACRSLSVIGELDRLLELGRESPKGQATKEEARSEPVLGLVAFTGLAKRDIEVTQAAVALLPEGFQRGFFSAEILREQGDPDAARVAMLDVYDKAETDVERREAVLALAQMGAAELPGEPDLESLDDEDAALVLAIAEESRGQRDRAIARLRSWRGRSLRCAEYLAELYRSSGRTAEAADELSRAARAFHQPQLLAQAAKLFYAAGDKAQAKIAAEGAVAGVTFKSTPRRLALMVLASLALDADDWPAMENNSRAMLADDPEDEDARWSLVAALFNAQKHQDAWTAMMQGKLKPRSEIEGRAWIDLTRRFATDGESVDEILDLHEKYPSEEFRAASLSAIFRIPVSADDPGERIDRFQTALERFFEDFPASSYLSRIQFQTPEEMAQKIREQLEPGATTYESLRNQVASFQQPYVVLAAHTGRSYVSSLLHRAAGCLTIRIDDATSLRKEIEAALAAIDGDVIADPTVLVTGSYIRSLWPIFVGSFRKLVVPDAVRVDAQDALEDATRDPGVAAAFDPASSSLTIHETSDEDLAELRERAQWVVDRIADCDVIAQQSLSKMPDIDRTSARAAVGPLDLAAANSVSLYSDEAVIRKVAEGIGVTAFGTVALLLALNQAGIIDASRATQAMVDLRRGYAVDLPLDSGQIVAIAEDNGWEGGPALFAFTRPAMWKNRVSAMALFRACCTRAFAVDRQLLTRWMVAGIRGLGLVGRSEMAPLAAAQLLLAAQQIAGDDPYQFAELAAAAQEASGWFGPADPVPAFLQMYFEVTAAAAGTDLGARALLSLASALDDANRLAAQRIAFGLSPDADV